MQFLAHPGGILAAVLIILLAAASTGRTIRLTVRVAVFAGALLGLYAAGAVRALIYVAGVAR